MKTEDLISKLESLNVPDIETSKHQQLLKSVLLNPVKAQSVSFLERIKQMSVLKKLGAGIIMAGLILAVGFAFSVKDSENIAHAKADDAVNKAFIKSAKLTDEQKDALSKKLKGDLIDSLDEAKQASDLTYLTPEEFQQEFNVQMRTDPNGGGETTIGFSASTEKIANFQIDKVIPDKEMGAMQFEVSQPALGAVDVPGINIQKPVKYLKYTDKQGSIVVLGIDENDIPVMKMVKLSKAQLDKLNAGMHIEGNTASFPDAGAGIETK